MDLSFFLAEKKVLDSDWLPTGGCRTVKDKLCFLLVVVDVLWTSKLYNIEF